jgi:hypothetical protein
MALLGIQTKMSSGELTEIKVGGILEGNKLVVKTDIDSAVALKADLTYVDAQLALKLNTPASYADFTAQSPAPSYLEGRLFYETEHHSLALFTDIVGVTHNLGQEFFLRVVNNTGAIITNGSVCRVIGEELASGFPEVILSLADTLSNAEVSGVATHDIPIGGQGFLARAGVIHGLDMNSYATGAPIYLSSTVPGGYTDTPTSIITKLGQVVKAGASGSMNIDITNTLSLPTAFGELNGNTTITSLTTSYQTFTGYDASESIIVTANPTTGTFVVPRDGKYRLTANVSVTVPTKASARSYTLQVYNATGAVSVKEYDIPIPRDTTEISRSFSVPVNMLATGVYSLRVLASESITPVTFTEVIMDIESIFIS